MSTNLKMGRPWNHNIKVDGDDAPKLNAKDPLQAAVLGTTIKEIKAGNFENVANLQVVAKAFTVVNPSDHTETVLGYNTVTTVADNTTGEVHELHDPAMIDTYCKNGFKIVKTTNTEIRG